MKTVEWHDVQGIVLSGYPMLPASAYLLWRFLPGTSPAAREWLGHLSERLTSAGDSGEHRSSRRVAYNLRMLKQAKDSDVVAINLALTMTGLQHLGVDQNALMKFSLEFQEGMSPEPSAPSETPRRSHLLGDTGASSPEYWDWGGWTTNRKIDGMLLLYAANPDALKALVESEITAMNGIAEPVLPPSAPDGLPVLKGHIQNDLKEHFGFADGISQPMIEGSPKMTRMAAKRKAAL